MFHVNVSAVPSGNDLSFNAARPSLGNDMYNPRRVHSDSVVPGVAGVLTRFVARVFNASLPLTWYS